MNWNWKFRAVWILCLGVNDMSREMKDSGVEWIGEIPKNWNVQRVKNAFVRKKAEAHQENPVVLSLARAGVKVRDLSKNEGQIAESYYNYNLVEFGDLLLNPMDLYSGANCSISMVEGVISPAYINLRAKSGYSSRFYDYYFKTQYWSMAMFAHGKGVSFENRWTLGIEELFNYKIPVPLENEQDKIADFLDGQCEKINLAIEKAKVSIEEYRNLKQSFITQIVTKGINENDTMKESGIEWIGKIPASWKVTQLRHCASIRSGITLLDYSKYYDKLEMPIPRNRDKVLEDLQHEKFIMKNDAGTWDITNMGALMIAKDLKKFESLHRRSVRVIWYKENSRLDAIREKEFCAGYAFSHEEIVQYIMTIIPQEEVIVEATRKSVVSFPEIAIRELLANAMIHQDLQQRGTNPMVEVFKNRIEFSNAGAPLVAIERIVDSVPVSRNENIAGFMHKCGICEERGSGYDKIVEATGKNELLAPRIENQNNQFTKAILFAKVPFELTTKEDRMRTCYMQACLAYVNFEGISNSDIRKIFGLGEKEKAKASRLLTSAVEGGYIKVMDPDTAPRYKKYIPYWA